MPDPIVATYLMARQLLARADRNERGEGVVSAAIAILIMAALGAVMWVGLQSLWNHTSSKTSTQVDQIGASPAP